MEHLFILYVFLFYINKIFDQRSRSLSLFLSSQDGYNTHSILNHADPPYFGDSNMSLTRHCVQISNSPVRILKLGSTCEQK